VPRREHCREVLLVRSGVPCREALVGLPTPVRLKPAGESDEVVMLTKLSEDLPYLILYSVGLGTQMRLLALMWRRFWGIEIVPSETYVLLGGAIGFLVTFGVKWRVALMVSLIVTVYFVNKLIRMRWMG